MADAFTHFVFVDFENVQKVDLGLVEGRAVHVTLLIGRNQKKIDLGLVQQMRRMPDQVELVEVGASGHNALDMTLAYYLGRAVQREPDAQFTIVSKDKDFEPMKEHLIAQGISMVRSDTFAGAFQPTKKPAATKAAPPARKPPVDRFAQLIEKFKASPHHRPKKKAALLHHIATFYGNKLSDAEVDAILAKLVARRILSIDDKDKDKVTYH